MLIEGNTLRCSEYELTSKEKGTCVFCISWFGFHEVSQNSVLPHQGKLFTISRLLGFLKVD
jgi:hypothetical protein